MKVAIIQDKLSDKLADENFATHKISPVEEDYSVSSMAELVRQRKIDALRIKELTLRITKAMAK